MPDDKSSGAPPAPNGGSIDADAIKNIVSEAIKPYVERIDGQSRVIAKLEGQLKDVKPPKEDKPDDKETALVSRVKELEEKDKKQAERAAKQREKAAVDVIKDAFIAKGVKPETAAWAAKAFYRENEKKIAVEEGDDLSYQIAVVEGDKKSDLNVYAAAFLETGAGADLIPSKRNPQMPGQSGHSQPAAGIIKYTKADLTSGNPDVVANIKSGKAIVVD